jgi:hypothetical protein
MVAIALRFLKVAWPFLLAGAVYYIAFLQGSSHGQQKAHKDFIEQLAKLDKKKCPDCKCPEVKPCPPQIDFDKIKSKNVTIQAQTVTNYIVEGDSSFREHLKQDIRAINSELDIVRVKKR